MSGRPPIKDAELKRWAKVRADDAGHLARELIGHRRRADIAERMAEALEFYADPLAWKKARDPDDSVGVPDFYEELSFGDVAKQALATLTPSEAGWRTIDSAPKDGTEILLWMEARHE